MATLSPATSPKAVKRKTSNRRPRLYPPDSIEVHNAGLNSIRNFLKCHSCYDAFPVSFRLIVLDTKLNVMKALQCLLLNGTTDRMLSVPQKGLISPFRRGLCPIVE